MKHKSGAVEQISVQAKRRGIAPPEIVNNTAKLKQENWLYFKAWKELETTRRYIGMEGAPSRISVLDVISYASAFNYTEYERDFLVEVVSMVDNEVLKKYGEDRSPRVSKKPRPRGNKHR